jgi:2-phospho-L-lactate/phosphoenolpyruvate guanylyltransferase
VRYTVARIVQTLAILPVKSFGQAKQRLAAALGTGARQALARAMFADVLASLRHVRGIDEIAVVTGDRLAESTARGEHVLLLRDDEQAGQSAAAMIGVRHALAAGFDRALLVPGDTPMLDAAEVDGMLARAAERRLAAVIVPDRHHTGTNALLLAPPDAIEPSFGAGSLARHVAAVRAPGHAYEVEALPSLGHDVDTPEDLAELVRLLDAQRGKAQVTRGALRQLDRSRGRPRAPVSA